MTARPFRQPGEAAPAKPAIFPHKPPANWPPNSRSKPSAIVRKAMEAAAAREARQ